MAIEVGTIVVSVVVCTRNRSQLLRNCLVSLTDQHLAELQYEVIVVDNCSMDDTSVVVEEFTGAYKYFRGAREGRLGLSYARNRGWQEAAGEYVAYIDDDAIVPSDWISQIMAFIGRRPEVLAFGGPYESYSETALPGWFPPGYGNWSLGEQERPIVIGQEWINGTNMVFRKEVFSEFGCFNHNLGMSGEKISYGEETGLLQELKKNDIQVYYVPNIKVWHLVADYKMKLSWLLYASYRTGRSWKLTSGMQRSLLSHVSSIAACVFAGIGVLLKGGTEPFKRRVYFSFSSLFIEVGAFVEYMKSK